MNTDIFTCLAQNSSPYAEALYKNLERLKSGKHQIRYHALVSSEYGVENMPKGWNTNWVDTAKLPPIGITKPSVNHAKLLNQIIKFIPPDSDTIIIADCDMFLFPYNWDEFINRKRNELDCIGTEKHDGSLRMFFIAFPTFRYEILSPNFMPGVDTKYKSVWTSNNSGKAIVADTGWTLEDSVINCDFKYEKFNLVGDQYFYNGQLFCAHLGGSHKKQFQSKEVRRWYEKNKTLIYK